METIFTLESLFCHYLGNTYFVLFFNYILKAMIKSQIEKENNHNWELSVKKRTNIAFDVICTFIYRFTFLKINLFSFKL